MAEFEKGKKYDVVETERGDCIGCCFHIEGVCNLDITIPCRKGFIFKEVKRMEQKFIIGDLVKVILDDEEQVVKVIGYDPTYKSYLLTNEYIDETRGCISFTEDKIKSIRLTRKILEKNGWVKDTHRHCLDEMPAEAYEKKDFPLAYFNVTFGKKRIQASHDCLFVRNLKYVSDLQHLLFGLVLNSEMEV